MLAHATVDKMTALHLTAMAEAFQAQLGSPQFAELSFDERIGLLIDSEWTAREQRKLRRRLRTANLRRQAALEDIDWQSPRRGLDRAVVQSLATCAWIAQHHNLILIGPTGIGKSWLAEAFAERACRSGYSAYCVRAPRLFRDLHVARGDGSYLRVLARLAKIDLIAIDDLGLAPLTTSERHDLLEVLEDRTERASTLITSQVPVKAWHAMIGEPTLADAICDRLVHSAHVLELQGPSLRDPSIRTRGTTGPPPSEAGPTKGPEPASPKPPAPRKRA
jgi:DNA replication protein DnaC